MDVEANTTQQENDAEQNGDASQKTSTTLEINGSIKDSPKQNSRPKRGQRRSRSQTPQKKTEDSKTLHVTLKKLDSELNGKEVEEETGKTEEKVKGKVGTDETTEVKSVTEVKNGEEESNKEKQSQKQKEEAPKKEEAKKLSSTPEKKEVIRKTDSSKKDTSKKGKGKREAVGQAKEQDTEPVEMDPLVITDEPDPELQFDENSDVESGKASPVISRCVTRRSQTRNIPTPKTPKLVDQETDSEKNSTEVENNVDLPKTDNVNDSCESMDTINFSTKVEVGSDITRMDYIEHHNSNFDDSSYLNASREKSLSETLRGLSARRPIRPLDDYRTRLLRSAQERSDLNLSYPSRDSVERITTGIKRKSRSITPEDRKKFKSDSSGINSLFSSPFANIRNKFKSDLPSSTPKLLGYRDTRNRMDYNADFENADDEKKSWCSIM